eukprot:jgi/Tetstr1/421214/TSEL_001119.t1
MVRTAFLGWGRLATVFLASVRRRPAARGSGVKRALERRPEGVKAPGLLLGAEPKCIPIDPAEHAALLQYKYSVAPGFTDGTWENDDCIGCCNCYLVTCSGVHIVSIDMASSPDIPGLGGPIPADVSALHALQYMSLHPGVIQGTLPPEMSLMTALEALIIPGSNITGTLPPEWSEMTALKSIDLESNMLSGILPVQYSEMNLLEDINLASNRLVGTVPAEWSEMISLTDVFLDGNCLTGGIPEDVW